KAADPGLLAVLLSAVLGGLILNLMPCVFPVLSLKALSLVAAREHGDTHQRAHALAYTAGVLLSFAGVAGALLAVRAAGMAAGWGFQLQSPPMVGGLAYLMLALGLFLSGAAEFGTGWMGAGQWLAQRAGLAGSFFTGVLATLVATPCTAPFMGAALGYAITQPTVIALAVFLALGLGLALPFLLLGFFPPLARVLPRPGAWMQTFKQLMAFPLYLTSAGLVWVLARQTAADGAGIVLAGMVLIAFAVWLWNRAGWFAGLLRIAAVAGALALLASPWLMQAPAQPAAAQAQNQAWSAARVAELRAVGRTVFVNFTADWCITCKVNERVALDNERVRTAFKQNEVVWLTGDWTRADPEITHVLEQFGRTGVPLYLVYAAGGEPKVLPQVLTPDIVIDAIKP
ncbi:MAG TPA: thioredoxin family protein, partial [Nevskiaceae bacterium]|nr:thioredoxin family protein [Nevskiaceae bacterium]